MHRRGNGSWRRSGFFGSLAEEYRRMLDVIELPQPSPSLSGLLLCHRIGRVNRHSGAIEACEAVTLADHHHRKVELLTAHDRVADRKSEIGTPNNRRAYRARILHERG